MRRRLLDSIPVLLLTILITYYLLSVFSTFPFIQAEAVGQALWWTDPHAKFFETLFDPIKQDGHPGRFRYVEYLMEAAYWKAMAAGWLPKDLYDYSAIVVNIILSVLVFRIGKQQGAKVTDRLLCAGFLLLSVQSYMVSVWHYRKAKFVVSLLFAFLTLLVVSQRQEKPSRKILYLIATLTVVGSLTDPYFILLAPPILFCLDLSVRPRHFQYSKAGVAGLVVSGLLVVVLNAGVAPRVNGANALVLSHIPAKPDRYLNVHGIKHSLNILGDLIGGIDAGVFIVGIALFSLLVLLWWQLRRSSPIQGNHILCFLLSLPISAFLVFPDKHFYCSYYGHTLIFLFTLACLDLFRSSFLRGRNVLAWILRGALFASIVVHQANKLPIFYEWNGLHLSTGQVRDKFIADVQAIRTVRRRLSSSRGPIEISLDHSPNRLETSYRDQYLDEDGRIWNVYFDGDGKLAHTTVGYFLLPVLFQREIRNGQVRLTYLDR